MTCVNSSLTVASRNEVARVSRAKTHGMTLVTRNDSDVADLGAKVLNPFR
jgi:hypothetical protein